MRFYQDRRLTVMVLGVLIHLFGWASASEPGSDREPGEGSHRRLGRLAISHTYTAPAEFKNFDSGMSLNSSTVNLNVAMFSAAYSYHEFGWSKQAGLPFSDGGAPWSTLQTWRFSGMFRTAAAGPVHLQFITGISSAFEDETSSSHAWSAGAMLAWPYQDDWKFACGLMARGHEVVDVQNPVLPAIAVNWRQNQLGWSAGLGFPTTEIRYAWNREFSAALGAGMTLGNLFRLADDSPVAPGAYAQFKGIKLELSGHWQVIPKTHLTWGIGWVGQQRLEFYDNKGKELASYKLKQTWAAHLGIGYRF